MCVNFSIHFQNLLRLLTWSAFVRDLQVFACARTGISVEERRPYSKFTSALVSTQLVDSLKMINILGLL